MIIEKYKYNVFSILYFSSGGSGNFDTISPNNICDLEKLKSRLTNRAFIKVLNTIEHFICFTHENHYLKVLLINYFIFL